MFKKFSDDDIRSRSNIKSSAQRGLKATLVEQFPLVELIVDDIIPKKSQVIQIKCEDKIQLFMVDNEVVVFQHFDTLIPTLKLVHKYPQQFPLVKVDRGAIKFVLSGANVMCPGLTSDGGWLPEENIPKDSIVTIYAEGKDNSLAIGKLLMDTDEIKSKNKGHGIELLHYLGDWLWTHKE